MALTASYRFKPWLMVCLFLIVMGTGFGGRAQAMHTYVKDGIKHYVIIGVGLLSAETTWRYNPDEANPYAKVKIHLCTEQDIENYGHVICGGKDCEDGDTWCCDGNDDGKCGDGDDYIPHRDNPDTATLFILAPLTIEAGMQVEIAGNISVVVNSSLTVNGTKQQPVSIDVGSQLAFASGGVGNLNWCHIRNGNGTYGGGLCLSGCASFSLKNSKVTSNRADYGGGIYIYGGTNILIENTEISGNNNASRGGGLYIVNASPIIRDCVIKSNADAWRGGGIYISGGSPEIINTRICDNSAQFGGGIYVDGGAAPLFVNSIISNNLGMSGGGGFYMSNASPAIVSGVICNNVIFGSYGGGIYGSLSSPTVTNTIVYGNLSGWYKDQPEAEYTFQQVYPAGLLSGFAFCNLQGQASGGVSCMDAPPKFAGESVQKGPDGRGAYADWSLKADSPCINAGTAGHLATVHDDTDAAGNDRPYNKPGPGSAYAVYADHIRVDIGAYEYQNNPPLLLDGNGNPVSGEIIAGVATDENTDKTISLFSGYHVVDVDGDAIVTVIKVFPDDAPGGGNDPAVVEYGQLFQFPGGDALTSSDNVVTDGGRRLIYSPANRMADYTASLTANFSDGESPSAFGQKVLISVAAIDDPPNFTTNPAGLMIYVGEQFKYSIKVENPDVDDTVPPVLSIRALPDWLSFWDNGDGTGGLTGTPSAADTGDTDIMIFARDGGGNGSTQEFTISVQEPVRLQVEVDKTSVSGAPGDAIALKASSSTMITNPSFNWRITDENGIPVATLSGRDAVWDTTGMAAGIYAAEVTLSDNRGSTPDSKTVTVALAIGFSRTDDDNRAVPTQDQQETINSLGGDSPADVINDMAALDLNPDQRDRVVAAITAKSGQDMTEEEANHLLGALDNLIIADPSGDGDYLTAGQIDQVMTALLNLAAASDLTDMQLVKLGETVDELIGQQGRENLSSAQLAAIEMIQADLVSAAARSDRILTAGGKYFSLASRPVKAATVGPVSIKTGNAVVTINDVDELKHKTGWIEFCIILTHNTASDLADVPVYTLGLYNTRGKIITLDGDLDTPLVITLPISTDSRNQPMYYDEGAGQWDNAFIYRVEAGDGVVTFKVARFGSYALFGGVISPGDATSSVPAAAGRSSSNCFLRSLFGLTER